MSSSDHDNKAGLKGEISNELTAVGGFEPSLEHL